ncbi:MAG: hypothetical protein JWO52_2215 [Gammaproteobacteria bacterium]|jgi:hypothetical protein|nr:hypothetical protein [Gammaproteobacteria bacterium]
MQLKVPGFELNRYCFVLSRLLPVAALVLFSTPGSSAQLTQYYLPATSPVTLRFSAFDPAHGPIDEAWLLAELATALQAQSARQFKSAGETTAELTGLRGRLDQEGSRIVFEYVHVARNRVGDEWGQTLTIPVSYRISRGNDVIAIRLSPPQTAEFATRRTPGVFFLPTPKLEPITELFGDFSAIMYNAPFLKLHHSFLLGGAEEAGVSPEACIANFDRLLGRYGYAKGEERIFDPAHDDVFLYRTARDSIPLKIAAVPYRGGSKVFYEAWVPFELHADGTVTGYDLPPALASEVRRILEDQRPRELEGGLDGIHED